MSVYQYISDNLILFALFWVFVALLGGGTAIIYRRVGHPVLVKTIGVLGGSAAIFFGALYLVTYIFDRGYPVPTPEFEATNLVADLMLLPVQAIAMASAALQTLDAIIFNLYLSTSLWLLAMGITAFKMRPTKEVRR